MKASVGYGSPYTPQPLLVKNTRDLEKDCSNGIIFSSGLGSKKTVVLAAKAKELGIKVVNMKKAKRAARLAASLKKKKEVVKQKKEQDKKEKEQEKKDVKKIGFFESVVPQLSEGKTKTYRLRDHGLKVGDKVSFENTQKKEVFGHAKITGVEKTKVGNLDLKDSAHYKTYDEVEELIEAFKVHYPEKDITSETDAWVYTYEFTPSAGKEAKK